MKNDLKQKPRTRLGGTAIFLLAVLGCAVLFMLYFGLFTEPRARLTRAVQVVSGTLAEPAATATPEPTPTPEPTATPLPFDKSDWTLLLANASNPLAEDFAPPSLTEIADGQSVDSRIADPIRALLTDAKAAGYTNIYFCSGYRDYDTQYSIYWNAVWTRMNDYGYSQEEAEAMTRLEINPPGSSEHQLGTTADILEYYGQDMQPYIGGSGLMLWLEQHCTEYGFILRYPEGKTDITGVEYEPWHLRYVGLEAAEYITENNLCLEEFLALLS